ncbi:hypothetical protein Lal_00021871 [Lupinus albus]|nr:hypothetical protein Lal_00021871 [Lupinus albus]
MLDRTVLTAQTRQSLTTPRFAIMIDERDAQKALLRHRPIMDSSFGTDRSFILARMLFILMDGNSTRIRRTLPDPPSSSSEPMEDESTEIEAEADADEDGVIKLVNIESSIEVIELSSDSGTEEDPSECSSTPSSAVVLFRDKSDGWEWKFDKTKQYSIKSAYYSITTSSMEPHFSTYPYQLLWKSKAPLKVLSFALRLFHDRIPTKDALLRRGVSLLNGGGATCSLCNNHFESSQHLFSSCSLTYFVWQLMYKWLNIFVALPPVPINHFLNHCGMVKDRKCRKAWSIIWFATVWAIWRSRNDFIFNNVRHSALQIMDAARVNAWLWIKNILGLNSFVYSD